MDLWTIENELMLKGFKHICGVDEAGRGPLAGAVFAAAVVLPFGITINHLGDSKKVPEKRRNELFDIIKNVAISFAVESASVQEIEEFNILGATFLAMNRAIEKIKPNVDIALIDGNRVSGIKSNCISVVGGDGKSASIAAASILAKVSRDRYMLDIAEKLPKYEFQKHKGYGTKLHYEKLREFGITEVHRLSFLKKLKSL